MIKNNVPAKISEPRQPIRKYALTTRYNESAHTTKVLSKSYENYRKL